MRNLKMSNKVRKQIIKSCKLKVSWYTSNEVEQDKSIETECISLGFTLSDFYATDGGHLNKILG